jgi:hypothetical protein
MSNITMRFMDDIRRPMRPNQNRVYSPSGCEGRRKNAEGRSQRRRANVRPQSSDFWLPASGFWPPTSDRRHAPLFQPIPPPPRPSAVRFRKLPAGETPALPREWRARSAPYWPSVIRHCASASSACAIHQRLFPARRCACLFLSVPRPALPLCGSGPGWPRARHRFHPRWRWIYRPSPG